MQGQDSSAQSNSQSAKAQGKKCKRVWIRPQIQCLCAQAGQKPGILQAGMSRKATPLGIIMYNNDSN